MTQQVSADGVYVEWSASNWLAEVTAKREAAQNEYLAAFLNFNAVTKTTYTADELAAADRREKSAAEAVLSTSLDEVNARQQQKETQ